MAMPDLSKLNICFLAGTLGQGGAERQLFYILRALRDCGAVPRVLCLTKGEIWEERIAKLGIPITWVGQQRSRLARLARIVRELRANPPDIIQSQHFYTNLYAVAASRLLRRHDIGAVRNTGIFEVSANGPMFGGLGLRAPRMIAANSRSAIRNAIAMGIPTDRLHFLPNVVDTDRFHPSSRRDSTTVRLITVGRLVRQKRLDRFLRLMAQLKRRANVAFEGVIVGEGPERQSLKEQAAELGLLPQVIEFRDSTADMTTAYQEADIFVLTSDWEGTPNVVLEAMASGLPVVATRVGGVPEVIEHAVTGFIVDPTDEDSMVDSLLTLMRDSNLRLQVGRRAREYVVTNHSPRSLPTILAGIYEVALS